MVLVLFKCSEIQMKSTKNEMVIGANTNEDKRHTIRQIYICIYTENFGDSTMTLFKNEV